VADNPLHGYSPAKIASVCSELTHAFASEWQLTVDELRALLGPDVDLGALLDASIDVPDAVLYRLGLLVGIDRAACSLLPDRQRATAFLRKPNAALNGKSVLSIMLQGSIEDIESVHRFLNARLV